MIAVVLVVAYLVAPGSQAPDVLRALGTASSSNIRALAGGVYTGGGKSASFAYPNN